MKIRPVHGTLALGASILAAVISVGMLVTRPRTAAKGSLECAGAYADALALTSGRARQIEQGPKSQYSYLVRSSATYECPFFDAAGKLRRRRVEAREHGTAFAYEVVGNETFLLTNEHVAQWPEVTSNIQKVDGVTEGCKRVDEKLRIVADERDDYDAGQVVLSRVVTDPQMDAAILKAAQKLIILPYRIGKSAALRQGNAVQVRGFPLGLMQAVNTGKVVNPYDRDQEQGWDHVDFVVDALLSEGNSGSPVLAMSCRTGELELVGMYHAGYRGHSALNVVVGIDQLRHIMQKKRRVPRAVAEGDPSGLGASDRVRLRTAIEASTLPLLDFGGLVARVEVLDGTFLYAAYSRDFPLDDRRVAVIEDRPRDGAFGELGRLWIRGQSSWRQWQPAALGADERDLLARILDAVRLQALRTMDYRHALNQPAVAEERKRVRELSRAISRSAPVARDLATGLIDLAERLGPSRETGPTREAPPIAAPVAPAPVAAAPVVATAGGPPPGATAAASPPLMSEGPPARAQPFRSSGLPTAPK